MLEGLLDSVSTAPWAYAAIAVIVALGAFLPFVPGETGVITGGVLAAQHELSLPLVVTAAFAGALAGDHVSFGFGGLERVPHARKGLYLAAQSFTRDPSKLSCCAA